MVKMLKKILMITSLKRFFKRQREGIMFMEIPTHFISRSEKEKFLEVTMEKLEKIIKI